MNYNWRRQKTLCTSEPAMASSPIFSQVYSRPRLLALLLLILGRRRRLLSPPFFLVNSVLLHELVPASTDSRLGAWCVGYFETR